MTDHCSQGDELVLVSIVVPVFNGMPYLPTAIESIKSQSHQAIELIAVDGGSTDGSVEWLAAAGVALDVLTPPATVVETWTRAIELASGDLVMLMCQDDVLYATAIAEHVRAFTEHPLSSASVAQRDIVDGHGQVLAHARGLGALRAGIHTSRELFHECFVRGTNVVGEPHCIMMRKDTIRNAMPWDGRRPYLLDLDTYCKALPGGDEQVVVIRKPLGAFRVSSSSWSTRLTKVQLKQMLAWQDGFATSVDASRRQRLTAHLSARRQSVARHLAYAYLSLRKRL
jgi:glycosyltransferase involved in cell wall biosynthesis